MDKKKEIYKKRQAIVEHPYGTMKRQWGFDHVMTKRYKERASADIGLIMSSYNLRILFNILTFSQLHGMMIKIGKKAQKWLLVEYRTITPRTAIMWIESNQSTGLGKEWKLCYKLDRSF